MSIQIDTKSGVPFYRQIIEQVKFAVARGVLSPGDRLPTVRQLAVDLAVNPTPWCAPTASSRSRV